MKKMKLHPLIALLFIALKVSLAQDMATSVPMEAEAWNIKARQHSFETYDERRTLALNGLAFVKDLELSNGIIEVDVYANKKRSFAGIVFRSHQNNREEVYMRMHKSSQADAVQYTPIFNGESNWQLYREHQANVTFKRQGWNSLRVEFAHTKAVVLVNDEKVVSINGLKTENLSGEIGLWALFGNRFSNFRYTKTEASISLNRENPVTPEDGWITQWQLTAAVPFLGETPNFDDFKEKPTIKATTEASGLLPISKYLKKPNAGNFEGNQEAYTVASTSIEVDENVVQKFSFDYSDKIIVYLNGTPIFFGNNAFRTKGVQFMGHMDIRANTLPLNLKKGKNTLHCVVIERANGWGLIGKIEE